MSIFAMALNSIARVAATETKSILQTPSEGKVKSSIIKFRWGNLGIIHFPVISAITPRTVNGRQNEANTIEENPGY